MNDPIKILKQIEARRKSSGLSQYTMIQKTGLSKSAIKGFSSQKHLPTLGVLCAVCELLDLDIEITPRKKIESNIINLEI